MTFPFISSRRPRFYRVKKGEYGHYVTRKMLLILALIKKFFEAKSPWTLSDLASRASMNLIAAGRTLKRMEELGWISYYVSDYPFVVTHEGVKELYKRMEGQYCQFKAELKLVEDGYGGFKYEAKPAIDHVLDRLDCWFRTYNTLKQWGWRDMQIRDLYARYPSWRIAWAFDYVQKHIALEDEGKIADRIKSPGAYFRRMAERPTSLSEGLALYLAKYGEGLSEAVRVRAIKIAAEMETPFVAVAKIVKQLGPASDNQEVDVISSALLREGVIQRRRTSRRKPR